MSNVIKFSINLSYERFLSVYQGHAKYVVARAYDGRNIQFPAEVLKPYLTKAGIYGNFAIHFDSQNKFKTLEKI